jgi:peroxiredoxin family protein
MRPTHQLHVRPMADHTPPDKLSLVVASGVYEKVHYALVMAAGAAAIGTPVTLFFTMGACVTLTKEPGWRALPSEKDDHDADSRDAAFASNGVATFDELIESCAELGVSFMVCEMGMRAEGLDDEQLTTDIPIQRTGVVTFMNDASKDGALVYI